MGKCIGYKMLVSFFSTAFISNILSPDAHVLSEIRAEMHIGLQVKCQVPCPILNKIDVASQIFIVFFNSKYKGNPLSSYLLVRRLQIVTLISAPQKLIGSY
jgi:hypothetical protein